MSFTQAKKNLIKILSVLILIPVLAACSPKRELPSSESTQNGTVESISYTETDVETDTVKIEMSDGGIIIIELFPDIAPETVKNFKKLVSEKFYDGIIFHRVISGFMIQGGDPTGTGMGGSKETVKGEFGTNGFNNTLSHTRGVISMARTNDPDSASSQFFICHADCSSSLDGNYAAFGKVIAGMDTVDKIASTQTDSNDRPKQEQRMQSVRFVEVN